MEEAFETYRDLYSGGYDVLRAEGAFVAQVTAWRLDRMAVFDHRLSGVIHDRQQRAGIDDFDHFVVTLVRSGWLSGEAETPFQLKPGQIILFDTARQVRTRSLDAHIVTVNVSRNVIEAALGPSVELHGHILSGPENGALADFMVMLTQRAGGLGPQAFAPLCRAFLDILTTAAPERMSTGAEILRLDVARRLIIDRHILDNLGNRRLSVGTISAATGISRSSLYRMFVDQGGVARHVRSLRLAALRQAFDEGAQQPLSRLAETFGFSDESNMSRQFGLSYGATPGAYRQSVDRESLNHSGRIRQHWAAWMTVLN